MGGTESKILIEKYIKGRLSEEEQSLLYQMLQSQNTSLEDELILFLQAESENPIAQSEEESLAAFEKIINADKLNVKAKKDGRKAAKIFYINKVVRTVIGVAAILLLIAGGVVYFLHKPTGSNNAIAKKQKQQEIAPGKSGAILTLADGTKLELDSLHNGLITYQSGAKILLKDGNLSYNNAAGGDDSVVYNTLSTPKGRQFKIVLPDGTMVWLNSASSLKFPTVFKGKERKVEIIGEGYFEVSKNAEHPFIVNINSKANLEVLGTHFNINAYNDEDTIKSTLLEGSVKMKTANRDGSVRSSAILKPGQQAKILAESVNTDKKDNNISVAKDVDVEKVVAWKNGHFNFDGLTLKEAMKQLERWYNIEVVYEGDVPNIEFFGELSRNSTLENVITALKDAEVHFQLEGRKLIVLK